MLRDLVKGLVIAAVIAGVIVAGATVAPLLRPSSAPAEPVQHSEFSPGATVVDRLPAEGELRSNVSAGNRTGVVLIDDSHSNRFDRAALGPLLRELSTQGYDVRFHDEGDLESALEEADAFVVIDPVERYSTDDVDEIEAYTRDGGRVLVLGEPTRIAIGLGLFGATLTTQESALAPLGNRLGVSVDTRYVQDAERHDGNFKRPLVRTNPDASLSPHHDDLSDVGDVALYTAAPVWPTKNGTVVLETHPSATVADSDVAGPIPVAVRDDNVLVIGDATFATAEKYTVADNEGFLSRVVEFLISGHHRPSDEPPVVNETADDPAANTS